MGRNSDPNHINQTIKEVISEQELREATKDEANSLLDIRRNQIYIDDEAFITNPESLLGRVIEVREVNGECPKSYIEGYSPEFSILPLKNIEIDENKNSEPLTVKSMILNKTLKSNIGFLNFFQSNLQFDEVYSLLITNQTSGLAKVSVDSWESAVLDWKTKHNNLLNDSSICYLLVVTGFVQKNIIRKKYKKFDGNLKGGAYGLNIGGSLFVDTTDFSIDSRFGLSVSVLHRRASDLGANVNIKSLDALELDFLNGIRQIGSKESI